MNVLLISNISLFVMENPDSKCVRCDVAVVVWRPILPAESAMPDKFQEYWNKNIDQWGHKYFDVSHGHETFDRPAWFTAIYNATAGKLERKLMKERYRRTIAFLDEYVKHGLVFSDLGCGTGIFVVEAAKRGAVVNAVDFSESSLSTTRKTVARYAPDAEVTFIQADVQTGALPKSDVTLAMGVTPYLTDIEAFLSNALPKTKILCCQYTDPNSWASLIRRALPVLDVRSLQCYSKDEISALYAKYGGTLCRRERFASGYIDVVANVEHLHMNLGHAQKVNRGQPR
jgi:SAM-dependent methyltransferase